jgi:hypothetical protein
MKIMIDVRTTDDVDKAQLRQRVADQIRKLANPVREDEGILVVQHVRIIE